MDYSCGQAYLPLSPCLSEKCVLLALGNFYLWTTLCKAQLWSLQIIASVVKADVAQGENERTGEFCTPYDSGAKALQLRLLPILLPYQIASHLLLAMNFKST